jgi:hypothetical protein
VVRVVAVQVQPVGQAEPDLRTLQFGHRDRAVQRDHRWRSQRQQLVVERDDLTLIGFLHSGRITVDSVDGSLNLIRPGLVAAQTSRTMSERAPASPIPGCRGGRHVCCTLVPYAGDGYRS